ncbi:BTAD domain-containing putative transcriptional regulator [Streptomyces sp. NPDC020412]|uniref:AfsR/SARP family transcriptional regulator n=1 Tax=Streptomyces sp. NPDC020412 TaxID=3365073 RepID=UPI0037ACE897
MNADGTPTARSPLDIKLLGPLRVSVHGVVVDPPDVRTRQLLALFAVFADHVVPLHVMVEELWPGVTPPGALSELHRRIADLKSRLARAGELAPDGEGASGRHGGAGERLVALPGGYRLDCSQATVDVRQFWRHCGAGFRAMTADDVDCAARRLGIALRLWTDDALSDVPLGPRLRREVEQLSTARAKAAEHWLEAELRCAPGGPVRAAPGSGAADVFERPGGGPTAAWPAVHFVDAPAPSGPAGPVPPN